MDGFSLDTPTTALGVEPVFIAPGSPGDASADSGDDTGTRKRKPRSDAGKSRGSRDGTGRKPRSRLASGASVDALTRSITVLTAAIAGVTKIQEIAFDEDDAKSEAMAVANMLDQFNLAVDPKLEAALTLIMTTGTICASKMYLYKERMKDEKMRNVTTIGQ